MNIVKLNKPKGLCIYCKKPLSTHSIVIKNNWFRGDDEVYKVHKRCMPLRDDHRTDREAVASYIKTLNKREIGE